MVNALFNGFEIKSLLPRKGYAVSDQFGMYRAKKTSYRSS